MSAEDMMTFLNQCNLETELKFRVAFHCGPVLKNVKEPDLEILKGNGGQLHSSLYRKRQRIIAVLPVRPAGKTFKKTGKSRIFE